MRRARGREQVVRPSPPAHRVLDARRCVADRRRRRRGRGRRPARGRHHRPREHVRRPRLLPAPRATPASSRSSAWRPTSPTRRASTGRSATSTRSSTSRCSPRPTQGYRNLIKVIEPRVPRRLLLQAPRRLGAARAAPRGHHRHDAAASAALVSQLHPAGRRRRPRSSAAARFQDIFGRDHFFVELQDHGLRRRSASVNPPAARHRPRAAARRCSRPTTATTRTSDDAEAHDALLCVQTGALQSDPKRFKFDGDELLPQVGGGDAPPLPRLPGGVRQHAADRRARRRRDRVRQRGRCPSFPVPRGPRRELVPPRAHARGRARSATATPLAAARASSASSTSSASSSRWGSPRTSSSSGTSSATRSRAASASVRGGGARRDRASRTACASSTSTRSSTTCCSSGSSTRAASRCPTSTWTSTPATAAR